MSWRVWGLDHCHGLKAGVAHRLEYYISVWYCGWTLEGLQYSFQPKNSHWCTRTGASLHATMAQLARLSPVNRPACMMTMRSCCSLLVARHTRRAEAA